MITGNKAVYTGLILIVIILGLTTLLQASAVLQQPVDQKGKVGDSVEFSVVAEGVVVSYQWKRDGVDIDGATNASYTMDDIGMEDNGAWFMCRVITDGVTETSIEVQLIVFQKGDYDWDGDIDNDDVQHLSVNLGRHFRRPLAFKGWQDWSWGAHSWGNRHSGRNDRFNELHEFDWNDDNRINQQDLMLLQQQCTNANCEVVEKQPPVIIWQKEKVQTWDGGSGLFTVTSVGPDLQYQWLQNGEEIQGETNPQLELYPVLLVDDRSVYSCRITNGDGMTTSREALLVVSRRADLDDDGDIDRDDVRLIERLKRRPWNVSPRYDFDDDGRITNADVNSVKSQCDAPNCNNNKLSNPTIVKQPYDQSVVENMVATFEVGAIGKRVHYQWIMDDTEVVGATKPEYIIRNVQPEENGAQIQCRITSEGTTLLTDMVTLNVHQQGDFDRDGDIDDADVRVVRELIWQPPVPWVRSEADFDNDRRVTLNDLRYIIKICSCTGGTLPPEITVQPQSLTVVENSEAQFSVQAAGVFLSYQWQENGVDIPGATESIYTLAATTLMDHGKQYTCVITEDGAVSVTSDAAVLQVDMDVPSNDAQVLGLVAGWLQDKASLSWQQVDGMRYQVHRGKTAESTELIGETSDANFLDSDVAYYFGWYYRIATVKDYDHPLSDTVYHAVGPLSDPVFLAAQPGASVEIADLQLQADGSYQSYFIVGKSYQGHYKNMNDPVAVEASGPSTFTTNGTSGSFSLVLPTPGEWKIEVTESGGYRKAAARLKLLVDSTDPKLVLHSGTEMVSSAPTVTISGEVSDKESGIKSITVSSNRYSQTFAGIISATGTFLVQVPVKVGLNTLNVVVSDNSGNTASATVSAQATIPALPQLTITSPINGATVQTKSITVAGTVRSSLPPEQIRLLFAGQVHFPSGADGNYGFSFSGVNLQEGSNTIVVTAETPYGMVSSQAIVRLAEADEPEDPEDNKPPDVEIFSAQPDSYLDSDTFQVSGTATGTADIVSVTINGQPATITGSGNEVSFQADLDFDGQSQLEVIQVITDSEGRVTTKKYTLYYDGVPPTISLTSGSLLDAPHINTVVQTPLNLQGTVNDANLVGFSINGQSVGLLPGDEGKYSFNIAIDLVGGQEELLVLKAWDKAGHTTSKSYVVLMDNGAEIEIISPTNGLELNSDSTTTELEITVRVQGLAENNQIVVLVDGQEVSGLGRNGSTVHGTAVLNIGAGEHAFVVETRTADGSMLSRKAQTFTIVDINLLPLSLVAQEPANNESGVQNNGFIAFYFNKAVNPALLEIKVLESYHGKDYAKGVQGADITTLSLLEMVEVHRDREVVPGGVSLFPERTMAAFYPERNFAFGATVYVDISYNGQDLSHTSFKVKPLPTFIQGFLADQFGEKIEGLSLSIPRLNRSTITDNEGSYSFGFGDDSDQTIPAGRYKVIVNPNLANGKFGAMELWATVDAGRLNEIGIDTVPVLNKQEPFRHVISGSAQVILAAGDLTLDLSEATLEFGDGASDGDVHAQFLTVTEQPYSFISAAAPQWVFNLNPNAIAVQGNVGVRIKMPAMVGSHEYVKYIGERVVMVGLDPRSLQLVPVGVGEVDTVSNMVVSIGTTSYQRLDIIGYALVDPEKQALLEEFSKGVIGLNELTSALTD